MINMFNNIEYCLKYLYFSLIIYNFSLKWKMYYYVCNVMEKVVHVGKCTTFERFTNIGVYVNNIYGTDKNQHIKMHLLNTKLQL